MQNSDIIEDMTILGLKIELIINQVFNKNISEIEGIVEETKQKINEKLKSNDLKIGGLFKEGKLMDLQNKIRSTLSSMSKEQSKSLDSLGNC